MWLSGYKGCKKQSQHCSVLSPCPGAGPGHVVGKSHCHDDAGQCELCQAARGLQAIGWTCMKKSMQVKPTQPYKSVVPAFPKQRTIEHKWSMQFYAEQLNGDKYKLPDRSRVLSSIRNWTIRFSASQKLKWPARIGCYLLHFSEYLSRCYAATTLQKFICNWSQRMFLNDFIIHRYSTSPRNATWLLTQF